MNFVIFDFTVIRWGNNSLVYILLKTFLKGRSLAGKDFWILILVFLLGFVLFGGIKEVKELGKIKQLEIQWFDWKMSSLVV